MSDIIDQLQLIDPGLIRRIAGLDADGLWRLAAERADDLNRPERPDLAAVYAYRNGGMQHFEKIFYRQLDDDPDDVKQGMIHGLAFIGKPVRLNAWAASGYLDHGSSAGVETSQGLMPRYQTDGYTEAIHDRRDFDVLEARHLDLIAGSIRRFENLDTENSPARRLEVQTMAKTLRSEPALRAAYIYQRQYRF